MRRFACAWRSARLLPRLRRTLSRQLHTATLARVCHACTSHPAAPRRARFALRCYIFAMKMFGNGDRLRTAPAARFCYCLRSAVPRHCWTLPVRTAPC